MLELQRLINAVILNAIEDVTITKIPNTADQDKKEKALLRYEKRREEALDYFFSDNFKADCTIVGRDFDATLEKVLNLDQQTLDKVYAV